MATATLQSFNVFLTERLTAAALDIYGFVEKTIIDYQEEVYRTKLENQRLQRLLDLVYKPEIRLHRADAKQQTAPTSAEEDHPKQQEWSPSVCHDEPGPSHIKEELEEQKEELWINGCKEQFSAEEDSDDGDALTKALIKTVQQLEDCTAAEESREPKQTTEEDPEPSEEKTSTTLYRCHICNYIFTKKTVLTWHLKTHEGKSHDSKGNFDCHICGKHIPCQSNLQNHMRVHTGERPYSCHFCGKCFKLKGHMTEHIRTHTGEKPFTCHICGKSFNRGSTLRKHVLAKHKEERPYKCGDCDELFTERLLMKRHMRKVHGIKLSTSQSTA
ncbi:zinc finger and BTB domain-containing protein 49-like [Toxotes jaculatrix]|uniref:zinc finger and BTB domain-containing protein 49-like n=1 Tax=Toxotes jaculatrix TaxID=941984 RepID=UPI001B3AF80D|nr:zinc finger and BTB domain-containing protein 49-like [Toxotes jaculatrix]